MYMLILAILQLGCLLIRYSLFAHVGVFAREGSPAGWSVQLRCRLSWDRGSFDNSGYTYHRPSRDKECSSLLVSHLSETVLSSSSALTSTVESIKTAAGADFGDTVRGAGRDVALRVKRVAVGAAANPEERVGAGTGCLRKSGVVLEVDGVVGVLVAAKEPRKAGEELPHVGLDRCGGDVSIWEGVVAVSRRYCLGVLVGWWMRRWGSGKVSDGIAHGEEEEDHLGLSCAFRLIERERNTSEARTQFTQLHTSHYDAVQCDTTRCEGWGNFGETQRAGGGVGELYGDGVVVSGREVRSARLVRLMQVARGVTGLSYLRLNFQASWERCDGSMVRSLAI